jgi:hypothetical protein
VADREQSINALITVLNQIDSVKGIGRQFLTFEEVADTLYPYLVVEEDETGEDSIEETTSGFANVTFTVNIIGYVNSSKDLATKINALDKLIKKTLGSDFTASPVSGSIMRNAGLIGFTIQPLREKTGTEHNPYGSFVRPVQLEYQGILSEGF